MTRISPSNPSPKRHPRRRRRRSSAAVLATAAAALAGLWSGRPLAQPAPPALAPADEGGTCRIVQLEMTPGDDLQLVAWIEDEAGNYVDTAFITQLTGSYGLGNRPGMMEFNSGYRWPYGRRTTTFPVWAHRHGMTWPLVVFQDGDERNLSHSMGQSSLDHFYCRPFRERDEAWDTQTCATQPYTDKGTLSEQELSPYPPRRDVDTVPGIDDSDVEMFPGMNPFDAVSRATPLGGEAFRIDWQIPQGLPEGTYVAWVEASKEFDQNESYSYPEPEGIPWAEYGAPYRGQPSVVYRVPFTIDADQQSITSAAEYVGYGDPEGADGELRPASPDDGISRGVPGSGASRLLLNADGDDMYRVRVTALPFVSDEQAPGTPSAVEVLSSSPSSIELSFMAPGDDDDLGQVAGYEIRYLTGAPITVENFSDGTPAAVRMVVAEPGTEQVVEIRDLLPRLNYSIGIRAFDECQNYGGIRVIEAATTEFAGGQVDACFVATAAYGSLMERDVEMLRRFRDRFLRTHVTGELLVQSYYTFGPALARLIGPSDTLRRAARATLSPLVERVRALAPAR
ncbi:fibronectin type III domain-containing protein [Haliangium ochraceum]|uniref:Fibronectin type III domain protein n=1 Tax=Haliangium ochraceum (strain DSM 14365 / JCM 11303 / SMP-2) TaxID=502025 RepID=D0LGE5_HALO1|nr:fibronectin type III domain-containing protein [Haliangium ochraceum]ACY18170.1 Fibronectin type III domain protein [Haliangium ochraceum DSM 14365]